MSVSGVWEKAENSSDGLRNLDAAMRVFVDQRKVAGLAVLIAYHDQIVHQLCYGKLNLATGVPIEANSIFRLHSLTKPVTAAAILRLFEEGHFDLHAPISKWIPAFKHLQVLKQTDDTANGNVDLATEITIWHLLTHTAGFGYGFEPDDPLADVYRQAGFFSPLFHLQVTLPELVHRLVQLPLANQPGERFRYSLSYDILAYLIELLSDEPFDVFLSRQILEPLGMNDTGFAVTADRLERFGPLYGRPGKSGISPLEEPSESLFVRSHSVLGGGGGLVSTLPDYLRFLTTLLNRGELNGVRVLKPPSVELMISSQVVIPFRPGMGYGLGVGVQIEDQSPHGLPAGVFGWDSAGGSEAWADPQTGLIAMIMYQSFAYPDPARQFRSLAFGTHLA